MKIAVFGCAGYGRKIMNVLKNKKDIDNTLFIDNSLDKIGTKVDDIEVVSLYAFIKRYLNGEINKVIIPNYSISTVRSMKMDLRKNGVKAEDVLIVDCENFISKVEKLINFVDYQFDKLPYIQYVSFEAAEKCNMNCKRCDHFSNLKKEDNAENVEEFSYYMQLLYSKVESIGCFSFLGGEPLLNDDLDKLLYITKQYYPKTQIIILTNGILLQKIPEKLIEAIRNTDTLVKMTLYPPLKGKIDEIVQFMRRENIRFELSKVVDEFWTQINIKGNSNPIKMLNKCVNSDCVMYKRGKLAKCPICMNSKVFNDYFNTQIPKDVLDLSDESITIEKIHKYLYNPIKTCAYCGQENFFEWERTTGKVDISEMLCSKEV